MGLNRKDKSALNKGFDILRRILLLGLLAWIVFLALGWVLFFRQHGGQAWQSLATSSGRFTFYSGLVFLAVMLVLSIPMSRAGWRGENTGRAVVHFMVAYVSHTAAELVTWVQLWRMLLGIDPWHAEIMTSWRGRFLFGTIGMALILSLLTPISLFCSKSPLAHCQDHFFVFWAISFALAIVSAMSLLF